MLIPSQVGTWLGFTIDFEQGLFSVPSHKIQMLSPVLIQAIVLLSELLPALLAKSSLWALPWDQSLD